MRLLISLVVAAVAALGVTVATPNSLPQAGSTVKVLAGTGHGSAVHLGQGVFLTAAHVVDGEDKLTIKTDTEATADATVLWVNKAYDIAMIYAPDASGVTASSLTCETPTVGDQLVATGNPSFVEFARMRGYVAARAKTYGPWKSVFVADMSVAPGMSGGPVFDRSGRIVGITVGVAIFAQGLYPLSYIVPSSALCMLTGRMS